MKEKQGSLSVKVVSRLSGVSAHTLRAWERRYGVVEPRRSPSGRRIYSMADVEKLSLLHKLTLLGHSIGNLAPLDLKELSSLDGRSERQLAGAKEILAKVSEPAPPRGQTGVQILDAVRAHDFDEVDRRILQARLAVPVRSFVLEVAAPLLHEVGELVAKGKLGVSHEHALSAILRNHLGELLAQSRHAASLLRGADSPRADLLFSTPSGDLHEFGILLAAILAGARGLRTHYLGPNTPPQDLAQAAHGTGARIVVLGCVEADSQRLLYPLKEYVRLLAKQLATHQRDGIEVWIGGCCDFDPSTARLDVPVLRVPSLPDFDARIERRYQGAGRAA